jgi:hypothetical protein
MLGAVFSRPNPKFNVVRIPLREYFSKEELVMKTIERLFLRRMRALLFLSVLPLSAATLCPAQAFAPHPKIDITFISVKPEMVSDFENMFKTDINPALAKAGVKSSDVWRTAVFGGEFDFVIVSPMDNFAQYDGESPLMRGMDREALAAWYARATKMVNGVRTAAYEYRPELSHQTNLAAPPKMAVVTFLTVAPGRNTEFENFVKNDWLPALRQTDVKNYWVHQTMYGGDINEYLIVTPQENFAELDKGHPIARVIGREAFLKMIQRLPTGVVVRQQRMISRYASGLSYRPQSQAAATNK